VKLPVPIASCSSHHAAACAQPGHAPSSQLEASAVFQASSWGGAGGFFAGARALREGYSRQLAGAAVTVSTDQRHVDELISGK